MNLAPPPDSGTTRLHKILSATRNVGLRRHEQLHPEIPARAGVVVVARLLDPIGFEVEAPDGRMMTAHPGDVLAAVLGSRRALRGYSGDVPATVKPGDVLHLLARGGVVGVAHEDGDRPPRVQVLGGVSRDGGAATIECGPVRPTEHLAELPPVVFIAGSCMHAGKTAAACALIRQLSLAGYRVGAAKLTGVALRRDTLSMLDHGAHSVVTFVEAGLPSTCGPDDDVVGAARGCLNELARRGAEIIIAELGDGLLGEYGVRRILAAPDLRGAASAVVLSAADPVAAWGGVHLLSSIGLPTAVITGPATDNSAGCAAVVAATGVPACNARGAAWQLAHEVQSAIHASKDAQPVAILPAAVMSAA